MRVGRDFLDRLETEPLWDGRPVPLGLKRRLRREYERLQMVDGQIAEVVAERAHTPKTSRSSDVQKVRQLLDLKGIGIKQFLAIRDGIFWLAKVSQPSGGWGFGRSHSDTLPERRWGMGARHQQVWESLHSINSR